MVLHGTLLLHHGGPGLVPPLLGHIHGLPPRLHGQRGQLGLHGGAVPHDPPRIK